MEIGGVGGLEADFLAGNALGAFHVCVHLEVEAAFELGALSGQFLRVEGYVLVSRGRSRHRHEVGHPLRAAQWAAAGAYAANAARFLAGAYLFHLDAHLEGLGEHFDKLTEVDAFVGDVIEYGLVAVALILDVADFHVELQVGGYLTGAYHRVVFLGAGFLITLEVAGFCLAEHALDFLGLLGVAATAAVAARAHAFHAALDKEADQGHHAYVVARRGLHCDHVAYLKGNVRGIFVITLAGVLEGDLDHVAVGISAGNVGEPVVAVELATRLSARRLAAAVA